MIMSINEGNDDAVYLEDEDMEIVDVDEPTSEESDCDTDDERFDPPRDDSCLTLTGHKAGVFVIRFDPSGRFLVSGGEDDSAVVWDMASGEEVFHDFGHTDSVTEAEFSPCGCLLAVGDMSGTIRVWNVPNKASATATASSSSNGNSEVDAVVACRAIGTPSWMAVNASLLLPEPEQNIEGNVDALSPGLFSTGQLEWLRWWSPPGSGKLGGKAKKGGGDGSTGACVLLAGDKDGLVTVWPVSTPFGLTSAKGGPAPKYLPGVGGAAIDAHLLPSSAMGARPVLAVLYNSGELRLWDLKSESSLVSLKLPMPTDLPVPDESMEEEEEEAAAAANWSGVIRFAIRQPAVNQSEHTSGDLIAVATGDGHLHIVPVPERQKIQSFGSTKLNYTTIEAGDSSPVEGVAFAVTHPFLAFCTARGFLGVLDVSNMRIRRRWQYIDEETDEPVGSTTLLWSRVAPVFFTSTLRGAVVAWSGLDIPINSTTTTSAAPHASAPLAVFFGHREQVLDLALPPADYRFVSSEAESGDCQGVSEAALMRVGGLAQWPHLEAAVVSCSDDRVVKVFRLDGKSGVVGRRGTESRELADRLTDGVTLSG